jgi:hypothetical protein
MSQRGHVVMFMAAASGGSVYTVGAGGMKTFSVLAAIMIEQCGTPGLYSPKMLTRPVTGP